MRLFRIAAILSLLCAIAGFAATSSKATSSKKRVAAKKSTSSRKAIKGAGKGKSAPAATWRTRQQSPTSDRYKEIQQALVTKGYLKTDPSGVWDADSINAMQRFQTDQKITPTGKINAPSLISLGLGAKSAGAPEAAPSADAPTADRPPPAAQ